MANVKLEDEDFKLLSLAIITLQAEGRQLQSTIKRAELTIAQAKLEAHEATSKMREVLDPLATKYGFDPDSHHELDYESKSLVPVTRKV